MTPEDLADLQQKVKRAEENLRLQQTVKNISAADVAAAANGRIGCDASTLKVVIDAGKAAIIDKLKDDLQRISPRAEVVAEAVE